MGCGYYKLVSLGYSKKGIRVVCYHRAEKTSKNYSHQPSVWNSWIWTVFGHFLSSAITWNTNSFFALTSIKRHKFIVPLTHIGNTKIFTLFGLFCNCGGSKRPKNQKNLFPSVFTWYGVFSAEQITSYKNQFFTAPYCGRVFPYLAFDANQEESLPFPGYSIQYIQLFNLQLLNA